MLTSAEKDRLRQGRIAAEQGKAAFKELGETLGAPEREAQRRKREAREAKLEAQRQAPVPVETLSEIREKAAKHRQTRQRLGLAPTCSKSPSKLAEEIAAKVLAPLPRAEFETAPKGKRPKTLYDTNAKPAVKDPVGAIVYGAQNPDAVLAKVIDETKRDAMPKGFRTTDRPIDYLRFRSPNPIDEECYAAATAFIADTDGLANFGGSNTSAIVEALSNAVPWEKEDIQAKEAGTMMPYGTVVNIPKDTSDRIMQAAWRTKRVQQRMQGWEASVLGDLLLREYPVGVIARRWGCAPEAASMMVKLALWRLVKVYEETDAEFRAWVIVKREMERQDG